MKKIGICIAAAVLLAMAPLTASAQMDQPMKCHIQVELTENAETKLGGALYSGPKMTPEEIMAIMKDAHLVHHPQYGGAFSMAPNKMNHVEVTYSDACGARVFMFNAYTEPIRADRFLAFVEFVPRDDDQFEVIRFLQPSKNGDYLVTSANHGVEPPFDIRLHMKFPGSDEVELFTVKLEQEQKQFVEGIGKVISIDHSAGKLVIDHQAIPSYMGAMTMPYAVSMPHLLEQVKPGMDIEFTLDKKNNVIVSINPITG